MRGNLVDIGDQFVGHDFTVFLPVLAVLSMTTEMITFDTLKEQNGHVDDVEVGKEVSGSTGHTHGQGNEKITDIVEVARESFFFGTRVSLVLIS
jgi:hypothetical protein